MEQLFRENPQYLQYTMTKHIQQILTLTKGKAKDSSEQELAAKTIVDCDEVYASLEKKLSALDAAKVKAGEEKAKLLEDALHEADSNSFLLFLASIGAGYVWAKKEEEKTKEDIGPA